MKADRDVRVGLLRVATVAAAFLVLGATAGCDFHPSDLDTRTQRFVIAVDSVSVPESIAPGETLTARFFGWIGPDGCSRLSRVERGSGAGQLELRFHGERRTGDWLCAHMPRALDHVESVPSPVGDPFRIRVLQPDGSVLEKVVRVR